MRTMNFTEVFYPGFDIVPIQSILSDNLIDKLAAYVSKLIKW